MHTYIMNTTLLALGYFDKFQPSKDRPQGVGLMHFNGTYLPPDGKHCLINCF